MTCESVRVEKCFLPTADSFCVSACTNDLPLGQIFSELFSAGNFFGGDFTSEVSVWGPDCTRSAPFSGDDFRLPPPAVSCLDLRGRGAVSRGICDVRLLSRSRGERCELGDLRRRFRCR
jgi:hypothetical protein